MVRDSAESPRPWGREIAPALCERCRRHQPAAQAKDAAGATLASDGSATGFALRRIVERRNGDIRPTG